REMEAQNEGVVASTAGAPGVAMKTRRRTWLRVFSGSAAACLMLLVAGDQARTATIYGIDPLEILNLRQKPDILFVVDSSATMQAPPDLNPWNASSNPNGLTLGGDDLRSRFYSAKVAVRHAVST